MLKFLVCMCAVLFFGGGPGEQRFEVGAAHFFCWDAAKDSGQILDTFCKQMASLRKHEEPHWKLASSTTSGKYSFLAFGFQKWHS